MAKSSPSYSSYSYVEPLHERPFFHYTMLVILIATLVVSATALIKTSQLKKELLNSGTGAGTSSSINANDFLRKLTSHAEMKGYVGIAPLNIVQVNANNIANLKSQINGLDDSYIGNFIVQYNDRIVVYDYGNDQLRGSVSLQQPQQGNIPSDFFAKLSSHSEVQGLQNEQPLGGQLDQASLEILKQQFPDVYANAKVGDYLLRFQTRLIIYDYDADRIVNAVNLG